MNTQTPGPLTTKTLHGFVRGYYVMHNGLTLATVGAPNDNGDPVANARLLASAYSAFDRAGRELGIDAAELAERIDLAKLLSTLRNCVNALNVAWEYDEGDVFKKHHNDAGTATLEAETILKSLNL